MKKITLFLVGLVFAGALWAQNVQVSGVVTDASGPAVGVSVVVKGTQVSAMTDVNGRYTINAPADATLVFSFSGMETREEPVNGRTAIDVTLAEGFVQLDEVIMVAYGTAKKGTQTAAISTVKTPALKDLPVTSFENALQGAAAGVQVGTPNGQPGAQQEIIVRGIGSYNASTAPLYVIDGIPATSGDYAVAGYGGSMSVMSTLNPSDIENITILKDAAATSLYGSRGANGVILVTTKKGKQGAVKVNLKSSWGFNSWAVNNRPMMGGDATRSLTIEGAYNQNIYNGMPDDVAFADAVAKADVVAPARHTYSDWYSELTRQAQNAAYEISVSGGDEKTTFYTSVAYRKDLGMFLDSDMKGYTGTANLTHRSNNWTINAGTIMAKMEQHITPGMTSTGSTAFANPYYASRNFLSPNIPVYNEDGTFYEGNMFGSFYNIVAAQKTGTATLSSNEVFKSSNNVSVAYEFIPGLSLKETLSYDHTNIMGTTLYSPLGRDASSVGGETIKQDYKATKFYSSLLLTYDKTFMDDHEVSALLGWDVDDSRDKDLAAVGDGFASPKLMELDVAATPVGVYSDHFDDRIVSYFGRVNYSYKNRYNIAATFRRDGSSRLGADTRWGNFWSVSGSWRLKDESFLQNVDWVDNLKIRASYGVSGTLPIGLYSSLATYSYTGAYNSNAASSPARVANPDLSWERNYVFDLGLEARLFDRVSVEFDFYDRQTNDLLLDVPLSRTTGFATTLLNVGGMNNRGVELNLGVDILKGNFFWNSTVILSHNRNKITELYGDIDGFANGSYYIREGYALNSFYMREWAGVDPGTGDSMWYSYEWEDAEGKRTYAPFKPEGSTFTGNKRITKNPDNATREIQAKADPTLTGGWRNTFSWKGFDLDFLFSFSLGGTSMDGGWAMTSDGFYTANVISELQADRWQKPGDQTNFPRRMHGGGHGNYTSSRWLHSTDHIRLKSATMGYTIPQKWTKQVYIQNARVFVAGNNLLTLAAYSDYDPEVPIDGSTGWSIPALKSVTFGVEIGF